MDKIVEKLKQRGYEASYKKSGKEEELIITNEEGKICSFYGAERMMVQEVHFDTTSLFILEKDEEIINEVLTYFHQKDKRTLMLLKGRWIELSIDFLQTRGYEETNYNEQMRFYDRSMQSGCSLSLKKDQQHFEEKIALWRTFQRTVHKWREKELLVDVTQRTARLFMIHLNGLYAKVKLEEKEGKLVIALKDMQENILLQFIPSTPQEIETTINEWIENKLKNQRLRSLTHPSTHFFDKWISGIEQWDQKEEIYQAFSQHYQGNEIEKIAAMCLKNEKNVLSIGSHQRVIPFKGKHILLSMFPCEVVVIEQNEDVEEQLVQFLLKQEEKKIRKMIQYSLGKEA